MHSPSPELLLSLSPTVLRSLVATFGPVAGVKGNAPPRDVVRAIFEGRAPAKLARVLAVVVRFATDSGLRAIVEAGKARRDPRATAWTAGPPGDVAAALAIESATATGATKRAAARVLALAGMRLERELGERPTYELIATAPVDAGGAARSIARAFGAEAHETWTHQDADDGSTRVAVFVRQSATAHLVLDEGAIVTRTETPVAIDLVRVEAGGLRASLTLSLPERLPRYASALGLSLRPSLTLRPLHDLTRETLARVKLPRGVQRATVVARRRRRSDGARNEVRAFDALDPAHDGAAAPTGYVDRATVRAEIGERVVDAFLQLPHRVEISDGAFDAPVREALAAIGLFEPGALPDDARSLAPYVHGDWRWRGVVGDEAFEAMVANGRLVKVIAAHVATLEHRMHGAGYVVRDVPREKGVQYALAEDRSLGARLVGKEERVAWRLDLAKLAARMRAELGAVAVAKPGALEIDGVIDLGVVTLASGKLRFVYALSAPAKGCLAAARKACGIGVTLVVLAPRGWKDDASDGVMVIELDVHEQLGARPVGRALGKAAEALGVEGEVEACRLCEEEVVVDANAQRVWVLGVAVSLSAKPYRFIEYLARRAGHVTTTSEIGAYVSSSGYPDVAARKTKQELEKQVAAALLGAGVDAGIVARLIVVEGRKGYRLGVSARVV